MFSLVQIREFRMSPEPETLPSPVPSAVPGSMGTTLPFVVPVISTEVLVLETAAPPVAASRTAKAKFKWPKPVNLRHRKSTQAQPKSSKAILASVLCHLTGGIMIWAFVTPLIPAMPETKVIDLTWTAPIEVEPVKPKEIPAEEPAPAPTQIQPEKALVVPEFAEEVPAIEELPELAAPVNQPATPEPLATAESPPALTQAAGWTALAKRSWRPTSTNAVAGPAVFTAQVGTLGPVNSTSTSGAGIASGPSSGAKMIGTLKPKYPKEMKQSNQTALVKLRLFLDSSGHIQRFEVLSPEVPDAFIQAAQSAARGMRYEPALSGGTPVESTLRLVVEFKLD